MATAGSQVERGVEQEGIREAGKATDGKSSKASSGDFIPGLMGGHGRVSGKKINKSESNLHF